MCVHSGKLNSDKLMLQNLGYRQLLLLAPIKWASSWVVALVTMQRAISHVVQCKRLTMHAVATV